jgi:hypothetical protein
LASNTQQATRHTFALKMPQYKYLPTDVPPPPSQIVDYMVLGGLPELAEPHKLKEDFPQLEYIMCCAEECKQCKLPPSQHFTETRVILPEELTEDNLPNEHIFHQAFEYIDLARNEGKQCYIHCARGRSRSATIVIAYLMHKERMSLKDAFLTVKRRRNFIGPHGPLRVQLLRYEKLLIQRGHYGTDAQISFVDMLDWRNLENEEFPKTESATNRKIIEQEKKQVEQKAKSYGLFDRIKNLF